MANGFHGYSLLLRILFAVVVIFCFVMIVSTRIDISNEEAQQEQLQEKIDDHKRLIEEYEDKLSTPFDDEYIIKVAKEKLNYCLPEEVIFYTDFEK